MVGPVPSSDEPHVGADLRVRPDAGVRSEESVRPEEVGADLRVRPEEGIVALRDQNGDEFQLLMF